MRSNYRRWSEYPYSGEDKPPKGHPEPGYWPMYFIFREKDNVFLDPFRQRITWSIKHPNDINWSAELIFVEQVLNSLTPQQKQSAKYWATRELTEKITTIIYDLAAKHSLGSPAVSRILGYFHASMNDTFVITWFLKYLWDAARPNQYDRSLSTVLSTPRFPSYPSAHATVAGCSDALLSYFFPEEASNLRKTMEASAQSRLYAGVHFKIDNDEGLRLGRQIGGIVVKLIRAQNVKLK